MDPRLLIGADVKETLLIIMVHGGIRYYNSYYYSIVGLYIISGLIPCLDFTPSVG